MRNERTALIDPKADDVRTHLLPRAPRIVTVVPGIMPITNSTQLMRFSHEHWGQAFTL